MAVRGGAEGLGEGEVPDDEVAARGEVALAPEGERRVEVVGLGRDLEHEEDGAQHGEHLERAPERARRARLERVEREERQDAQQAELHQPLSNVDVADEEDEPRGEDGVVRARERHGGEVCAERLWVRPVRNRGRGGAAHRTIRAVRHRGRGGAARRTIRLLGTHSRRWQRGR